MKILAVTNLYPPHYLGGYELICYHVLRALHARGHEIAVLTSDHGVELRTKNQEPRTKNQEPRTVCVERTLKIHGFYGHPWLGIRVLRHLERHNNDTLRRGIDEHHPDLVFVWNMGGLSKSMLLTLQSLNIPTVFYISDHWIDRGLNSDVWLRWWNNPTAPLWRRLVRKALGKIGVREHWQSVAPTNPVSDLQFRRIYFCSRALRDRAVAAGFRVEHAAIIPCPVDVQAFQGNPKPPNRPLEKLLFVGRLSPDKGVKTALKAMNRLKGVFNGSLTLCGRGDVNYVQQLERFVRTRNLHVTFESWPMERMPEVYGKFDTLLFTSEWEEPFALTPLEAMASGLPVIATTTGGSAELFRDRENCLTYEAGNVEQLAERILELAASPALRVRIATAGHCEVRERYAERLIVSQIEAYLEESVHCWQRNF